MNNLHLTEIMQTYWLQMLDDYWDENIHPTHIIMVFGLIGCINISIDCG